MARKKVAKHPEHKPDFGVLAEIPGAVAGSSSYLCQWHAAHCVKVMQDV